ncbi:hypothetical protein [Aquimarina litoralis]|uniref:hypothetical protein n=1 Tax=Aquimarina litoralis TaxID=584605 RepID=UPI001C55EA5A|nr:hypothetical protein [Aquimarina litoralis]MBW1297364.1 hypothetical protein [Aquimarina litoralis]
MKSPTLLVLGLFTFALLIGCSSSDDGGGGSDPDVTPVDPDPIPTQTSTYIGHVKTIIDTNCLDCHGSPVQNSAPMELVSYQQVVDAVNDRNLFSFISTTNAFNVMPPSDEGGRMPQATIDIVEDWIADGLLEQ